MGLEDERGKIRLHGAMWPLLRIPSPMTMEDEPVDPWEAATLAPGDVSVVVADDDREVRASLAEVLTQEGFDVVGTAADGRQAVSVARETSPDVVLMDFRMPEMDGIEAARLIRQELATTQVMVLSVYDDPGIRLAAEEASVYCYLVKGCPPSMIYDMLLRAAAYKRELELESEASIPPVNENS